MNKFIIIEAIVLRSVLLALSLSLNLYLTVNLPRIPLPSPSPQQGRMNICQTADTHAIGSTIVERTFIHSHTIFYTPFNSVFNLIISTIAHALNAGGNGISEYESAV